MRELVLASASKRRYDLLKNTGYKFRVIVSDLDETSLLGGMLSPEETVMELSRAKALNVKSGCKEGSIVLAADTVVVIDGDILGKPSCENEALYMLRRLSGRTHNVYTAVTITEVGKDACETFNEKASVSMSVLTDDEIIGYIKTGQPLDKAGSYGIQGIGGLFVERIEGDFFAIEGLPINKVYTALKSYGVYPVYRDTEYI